MSEVNAAGDGHDPSTDRSDARPVARPGSRAADSAASTDGSASEASETAGHDAGAGLICDVCGAVMFERHCKILCPVCGYQRDCSDP